MIAGEAKKLGLYGFGAAGHIVAQAARWQGRQVFAFTRPGDVRKQEFAKNLGAVWAGGSNEMPPERLDVAIIYAAVGALAPLALKAVRKGARARPSFAGENDQPSRCGKAHRVSRGKGRAEFDRERFANLAFIALRRSLGRSPQLHQKVRASGGGFPGSRTPRYVRPLASPSSVSGPQRRNSGAAPSWVRPWEVTSFESAQLVRRPTARNPTSAALRKARDGEGGSLICSVRSFGLGWLSRALSTGGTYQAVHS